MISKKDYIAYQVSCECLSRWMLPIDSPDLVKDMAEVEEEIEEVYPEESLFGGEYINGLIGIAKQLSEMKGLVAFTLIPYPDDSVEIAVHPLSECNIENGFIGEELVIGVAQASERLCHWRPLTTLVEDFINNMKSDGNTIESLWNKKFYWTDGDIMFIQER